MERVSNGCYGDVIMLCKKKAGMQRERMSRGCYGDATKLMCNSRKKKFIG